MKIQLRQQKFLERINHKPQERVLKSHKIITKLTKLSTFKKAKNILLYLPIHGEVDLMALFKKKPGKSFVLPRVKGKKLDLFYVKNIGDTEMVRFQLREPKKHLPKTKIKEIDLILVPGIAFSLDGHRIGYGKGYYDRLLKKTRCPKIGIAYDFQIVKNMAVQEHDVPMDIIITDRRIIKFH